jgi:hypothetical protein
MSNRFCLGPTNRKNLEPYTAEYFPHSLVSLALQRCQPWNYVTSCELASRARADTQTSITVSETEVIPSRCLLAPGLTLHCKWTCARADLVDEATRRMAGSEDIDVRKRSVGTSALCCRVPPWYSAVLSRTQRRPRGWRNSQAMVRRGGLEINS